MSAPIVGCVGPNGHGKSLCAVHTVIAPAMAKGRPVLSNVPIFASADDRHERHDGCSPDCREYHRQARRLYRGYVPLDDWHLLVDPPDNTTIFTDEISSVAEARESSRLPLAVLARSQQMRRRNLQWVWTAPSWKRADIALRQVTQGVWLCRGFMGRTVHDDDGVALDWPENRVFRWKMFDATDYEEFSLDKARSDRKDRLRPVNKVWHRKSHHPSQWLYDTLIGPGMLDHLDERGACLACGGTRRAHECTCGPYVAKKRAVKAAHGGR